MSSRLIVGLGNPGRKYEKTRHNAGFKAVDFLVGPETNWTLDKKSNALVYKDGQTIFAKPQTFMNESGKAVRALVDYYKIKPKDVVVIYDEIDLEFGTVRVRETGSSAGHNGIKSIISHLNTKDFVRIRIGISNEKRQKIDAHRFVLKKFSRKEQKELKEKILPEVVEKIQEIIK